MNSFDIDNGGGDDGNDEFYFNDGNYYQYDHHNHHGDDIDHQHQYYRLSPMMNKRQPCNQNSRRNPSRSFVAHNTRKNSLAGTRKDNRTFSGNRLAARGKNTIDSDIHPSLPYVVVHDDEQHEQQQQQQRYNYKFSQSQMNRSYNQNSSGIDNIMEMGGDPGNFRAYKAVSNYVIDNNQSSSPEKSKRTWETPVSSQSNYGVVTGVKTTSFPSLASTTYGQNIDHAGIGLYITNSYLDHFSCTTISYLVVGCILCIIIAIVIAILVVAITG